MSEQEKLDLKIAILVVLLTFGLGFGVGWWMGDSHREDRQINHDPGVYENTTSRQ